MDIKLSLIEGASPNTSNAYENRIYANTLSEIRGVHEPGKNQAYQPFFATDIEMSKLNDLLKGNSLFKFHMIESAAHGIGEYSIGLDNDTMSGLGALFVSDFYQRYYEHVNNDFKTQVNNRYSWVTNLNLGIISKISMFFNTNLIDIQQRYLEETEELENKLARTSIRTSYENSRSEKKIYLKLKICLNRNLGVQTLDNFMSIIDNIKNEDNAKSLMSVFEIYKNQLEGSKNCFYRQSNKLVIRNRNTKGLNNDMIQLLKEEAKPINSLNGDIEQFFGSADVFTTTLGEVLLGLKSNVKTIAKFKYEFNKEIENLATHLMITLISENFEKIKQCQQKAQKTFQTNLTTLKNLLKDKIHTTNALIRKKNRQHEAESISLEKSQSDPDLCNLLDQKQKYEQKIQYEKYLYTNRILCTFKKQFKLLKVALSNIPLVYDNIDALLQDIAKDFQWEISNLNNFDGLELHDALVYNYTYKQYETIGSMFKTFYEEAELQDHYQNLCLSHAQLRYFSQIVDYYYALNSNVRRTSKKNTDEIAIKSSLESKVNFNIKEIDLIKSRLAATKNSNVIDMKINSTELFYIINWIAKIKIDKCCTFEQKTDFSKFANSNIIYRSELFNIVNRRLLCRKGLKNTWFTSDSKRIDTEGQLIDMLQFILSADFWSLNSSDMEPYRIEVARAFSAATGQFSNPDIIYVNSNLPSASSYERVIKHVTDSVYKMWVSRLNTNAGKRKKN